MEKISLSERILNYLRKYPVYWNGGEIERLALTAGYKASNASRRLRELHEEGLIEREERKRKGVKSVWYRINSNPELPF